MTKRELLAGAQGTFAHQGIVGTDHIEHPMVTYDDIVFPANAINAPGAIRPPASALFRDDGAGSDGIYLPMFNRVASAPFPGQTKDMMFSAQLPHRYARGENLYIHVHWSPGANGVAQDGTTVDWKIEMSFAAVGAAYPLTGAILSLASVCSGVDYFHEITPDIQVSGAGIEESAIMVGRLYRDDAVDTFAADTVFLLGIDIHYPVGKPGSRLRVPPWD
jgi:hypothetical protein